MVVDPTGGTIPRLDTLSLAFLGEESHLLPMLVFRITLEARNLACSCLRQYRLEGWRDLFGVLVVAISYGRIGTVGRSRSYVVRDEAEARCLAQSILKRRATAPRRIGVGYRIRELIDPEGWAAFSASVGAAEEDWQWSSNPGPPEAPMVK